MLNTCSTHNSAQLSTLSRFLDAGQPESLEDVLTAVRDVSGLEIQCVTYQQKQSSLLEKLVPIPGYTDNPAYALLHILMAAGME